MIEKIRKILLRKYNVKLETYKVLYEDIYRNKILVPAITLFLVSLVVYFTTSAFDFIVLLFLFFMLVIVPLALRKEETYDIVIITPEYIIKQITKRKVIAIKFDNILKFGTSEKGIVIKDFENEISLDPSTLGEEILIVMDILEAKGKTFDKKKDYMIRPIEIQILDGEVKIIDIKISESTTDEIVAQHFGVYEMLTPGFIEDIVLLNSIIEEAYCKDNNLYIKVGRIEVKQGHPENTLFESQIANDCILIFENANALSIVKKGVSGSEEEAISDLDMFTKLLTKGVISDWKYRQNEIDLQIYVEQYIVIVSLEYEEVIVGWNKFV